MSEKLTVSITHKCTSEEKEFLEALAVTEGKTLSELVRENNMVRITAEKERLHALASLLGLTRETRSNHLFELTAPLMDVTPIKQQAQKKPNCYDQLSLIATHNQSYE